jgi:phosphoribosyl 1,2-cyclic phosphodiesterase
LQETPAGAIQLKIKFLGTRGYIEAETRRHRRHSAVEISYYDTRIMIDCGDDWAGELQTLRPDALVVTHAHPDHVGGLQDTLPCPVYATSAGWERMAPLSIPKAETVRERRPFEIGGIEIEAFPVEHSLRAPAVGYRVTAGRSRLFYVPDVVYIPDRQAALRKAQLYVGDGATLSRSFVRKRGERLIGHAPVRTQLTWCAKEGVPRAIVTHCGSEIVRGDERKLGARLRSMGRKRDVQARIAYDGMEVLLR